MHELMDGHQLDGRDAERVADDRAGRRSAARADRDLLLGYKATTLLLLVGGVTATALAPVILRLFPAQYAAGVPISVSMNRGSVTGSPPRRSPIYLVPRLMPGLVGGPPFDKDGGHDLRDWMEDRCAE